MLDFDFPDVEAADIRNARNVQQQIFFGAVRWICHHELAHIWNGHLEYRASSSYKASDIPRNLIDIALEIDADSRAVRGIIMDLISPLNLYGLRNVKDQTAFDAVYLNAIVLNLIGIFAALHVSTMREMDTGRNARSDHPPAVLRFQWIARAFRSVIPYFIKRPNFENAADMPLATIVRMIRADFHEDWLTIFEDKSFPDAEYNNAAVRETWNAICGDLVAHIRGFQIPGRWVDGRQDHFMTKDGICPSSASHVAEAELIEQLSHFSRKR